MPGLVDTHCHLGHIDRDPAEVLHDAVAAGVDWIVDVGMGTEESAAALRRAEGWDGRIRVSVGLHPNALGEFAQDADAALARLAELAANDAVVGIGETGLDFYRDREPRDRQESAFRAQISLAKRTGKTLVIHCRNAHARVMEILDSEARPERVVMHCFSGDAEYAARCADRGLFCSFAGNLTYKRSEELREAARVVPDELLLVETDAPFLAPDPHRGKPNSPALVAHTADRLADVRGMSPAELRALLGENSARAFAPA